MLILKPLLIKQLTTTIIGPHGITDLIHAERYNKLEELYRINALCAGTSLALPAIHLSPILDVAFLLASIVHFRRDMPVIINVPRYLLSTTFIAISILKCPELFFFFMVFIHVPRHYIMNADIIKKNMRNSFFLILATTLTMGHMGTMLGESVYIETLINMSKGIVISHIVYEELFVHNRNTTMISF